jgi:hypothetical protein
MFGIVSVLSAHYLERCFVFEIDYRDYLIEEKKYDFFHAWISRCGKGRVCDFLGHKSANFFSRVQKVEEGQQLHVQINSDCTSPTTE